MAKLVILTHRSPIGYYTINQLSLFHQVVGVVFEKLSFRANLNILNRRKRRLGLNMVMNQLFLLLYSNLFESGRTRKMTKDIFKQPFEYLNVKTAILETGDVNSEAMTSFVSKLNPEFVIVSGTSLLSKDTIKAINRRILNIHVGITPEYRGAHGGFWALYNNEANKVGVTVHLIDTGIDTGPILAQSSVAVNRDDTLKTIVNRQQKVGVDLVIQSIKELQEGSMPSFQNRHSPSKLFYSPGLTHYLRLKRRIRKGEVKVRDHND